jgi:hypothetical protein
MQLPGRRQRCCRVSRKHSKIAAKQSFSKARSNNVFGQRRSPSKMFRASLYARVSTNDQQALPMHSRALRV